MFDASFEPAGAADLSGLLGPALHSLHGAAADMSADLLDTSTLSAAPVSVKDLEKALSDARRENFDLKLRIYNLELRSTAQDEDATRDWRSELQQLQEQNELLKADGDNYKRLLLDAQKAVETLKTGAFHSAALKALTQTNKELEDQVQSQAHELDHLRQQTDALRKERDAWRDKASEATAAAQRALQAAKTQDQPLEDAAFQRAKVLESERDQLQLEAQSLRAEAETNRKVLTRYRLESEGHYTALQTARERLKRMTTVFDRRVAEVRQEESDRYQVRLQQLEQQIQNGKNGDRELMDRLIERNALMLVCIEHLDAVLTPGQPPLVKATSSQLSDQALFHMFEHELLARLRALITIHDAFRQGARRLEMAYTERLRVIDERVHQHAIGLQHMHSQIGMLQTERRHWSTTSDSKSSQAETLNQRLVTELSQARTELENVTKRASENVIQMAAFEDQLHVYEQTYATYVSQLSMSLKKISQAASLVRGLVAIDRHETIEEIAEKLMEQLRHINACKGLMSNNKAQPPVRTHALAAKASDENNAAMLAQQVHKLKQQLGRREFLIKKALSRLERINEQKEDQATSSIYRQVDDVYQQMRASTTSDL